MGRYEKLLDIMKKASGRIHSNNLLSEGELATTKALNKAGEEAGFYDIAQHTPEMASDIIKNAEDKFSNPAYLSELQAADNGQGLGTMLLKRAEDEAYKNGADSMYLVPDSSIRRRYNQEGLSQENLEKFYEKAGYKKEPLARRGFDDTQGMSKSFEVPPLDMSVEARAQRAYEQGYLPDKSGKFINTHTGHDRSANAAFDPKDIDKNKLYLGASAIPMAEGTSRFSNLLKDNAKAASAGIADAATLGFGDELGGALASGLDKGQAALNKLGLAPKSPSQVDQELGIKSNMYKDVRDSLRKDQKEAMEQHPAAYFAGNVVGGMALPLGGSIGEAAALGAGYGLGSSEEKTALGMAKDATLGAGLGAGFAKAGQAIGNAAGKFKGQAASAIESGVDKLRNVDEAGMSRLPSMIDTAANKIKDVVRPASQEYKQAQTTRFKSLLPESESGHIYNGENIKADTGPDIVIKNQELLDTLAEIQKQNRRTFENSAKGRNISDEKTFPGVE